MRAHVSVASNIQPEHHVPQALTRLAGVCTILRVSPFYRTEPIGRPEQEAYWNGVALVEVEEAPVAFQFETLRGIEAELGRVRTEDAYAARTIDLDLLTWGEAVVEQSGLHLPDPEVLERPFLARCLLDLDPGMIWPGTQQQLAELVDLAEETFERVARAEDVWAEGGG
ncbi:MAG: 2-amino-4-hydroxy-6-hydroxymethyldihydropteridine diphosphokinase [Candidatus Thermoplasmatota archaeon]|nr:2-amino-4-hydroxy-6-hydroxymethyldihydropteridine diphosphokinase [Candidatus Thermoplasmatota archaeon]